MKESGNGSNDNAGEQEDRGQPLNTPGGRLIDHQDYLH